MPLLCLCLASLPSQARAQDVIQVPEGVSITGRVLDAYVGGSLADAEVALVPFDAEAAVPDSVNDAFLRRFAFIARRTDGEGSYRFADVTPGVYLVSIRRPGYRPVLIRVTHAEMDTRVSVALELQPISLEPLEVKTRAPLSDWVDVHGERAVGTLPVERLRQKALLSSDARVISAEDVRQAATPGEADVFRSLHRLPGVSTRDDWSAEIWTRGASFGETRVYLDGLPLFNPLHAFGLLSGMSSHGIGPMVFQPGIRSESYPEGAAAVVDLTSRSGRQASRLEGGAEATLASLQAWGVGSLQEGRGGWQLSGRRSWIDVGEINPAHTDRNAGPYVFSDLVGRLDLGLGDAHLMASGLIASDHKGSIGPESADAASRSRGWLASARLDVPFGGLHFIQSIGVTRYDNVARSGAFTELPADRTEQVVDYARYAGEVVADTSAAWRAGYDFVREAARYHGPIPWPYDWRPVGLPRTEWDRSISLMSLWGEHRWLVGRFAIEGSVRATSAAEAPRAIRLLPAIVTRLALTRGSSLSIGAARYIQFAQSPAAMSAHLDGPITGGRVWVIGDPTEGVSDTRTATFGGEAWLGESWLFAGTLYWRDVRNALLPNAAAGLMQGRSAIVEGNVVAKGIDLSVRRLSGRITGSASYSLGRADATAAGLAFRPPTDRRHLLDVAGHVRLTPSIRLSGIYSFASGAPFAAVTDDAAGGSCDGGPCNRVGPATSFVAPFDRQTPAYGSLDLAMDWSRTFGDWGVGVFIQVQNALHSGNAVTYRGPFRLCGDQGTGSECAAGSSATWVDYFYAGIPILPLLGLRVGF